MEADSKRRQVSFEQLNALLDFMKEHPELAKGLTRGRRGKLHTLKIWNLCAKKLNTFKDGASKDGKGWSKYWCDWKYRVRRRALELKAAKDNNRPPPDGLTPLSAMEETILSIIGDHAVDSVIIKSDPLGEDDTEGEAPDDHNDAIDNQCYETRSRTLRGRKRRQNSNESSDIDNQSGPSSPLEKKPRVSAVRSRNVDEDDKASEFLQLEKEVLDNSKKVQQSLETIASEITRLTDIISHIRDVLINNRINLNI